mgnify:CR=1 FL=1|jgi:hypothetical protein
MHTKTVKNEIIDKPSGQLIGLGKLVLTRSLEISIK